MSKPQAARGSLQVSAAGTLQASRPPTIGASSAAESPPRDAARCLTWLRAKSQALIHSQQWGGVTVAFCLDRWALM